MKCKELTKTTVFAAIAAALAFSSAMAWAADKATAKEAEAMVKKAVAFFKANGRDKAYAEISNKQGQFVNGDLYLMVQHMNGTVLAHGVNEKLIGKVTLELKDVDGKEFVRERVELGKAKGTFWQDYKFTNPVTKKVEPKSMYCERIEEAVLCGGIYK